MEFPLISLEPCVTLHTWSMESVGTSVVSSGGATLTQCASAAFPGDNSALFFPFYISKPITALNLMWINGTLVKGNIDVGIYTEDGTRLVSTGSTAVSGTAAIQSVPISLELGPGVFYFAVAMDTSTGTLYRGTVPNLEVLCAVDGANMPGAFPLPATATLSQLNSIYIPLIGLTTRSFV